MSESIEAEEINDGYEIESLRTSFEDGFCYIESVETNSMPPKQILQMMELDFPENALTAIMGPSGSGKTTLLSVITDNIPSNITARAEVHLPGEFAFVPQDDRLHGFYTCKSYMEHYARLTGIAGKPGVNERIDALLQRLGLTEQKNTIVGDIFLKGLSGGQQRRLSIALEALTQPKNFFLDEPTSGLDAESALQVMEFLKTYVREGKGRRVVLTIHQPSSFIWNTIDNVILLSKGRVMYNGGRSHIEEFFESAGYPTPVHWNPAEHYVTVVNDDFRIHQLSVEEWGQKFQLWSEKQKGEIERNKRKTRTTSMMKSIEAKETDRSKSMFATFELTYRYFLNLWFNPGILLTRLAMYVMLAAMVGALFWNLGRRHDFESIQSRIGISFYCVSFFIFMSVAILPFTVIERAIVDKEVLNKYYHPTCYQLAQAIASIPGTALLAFLTSLLIITMTKLNDPYWYFLDMWLSLNVSEALAHLVSHIVPHFVIGMALLAGLFGFFMLFLGFMLIPSDFPNWLRWLYPVAFHTYSWRTFMFTEFGTNETFTGGFANGHDVLVFYEIDDVDRGLDMVTLVGYALFVHCLSLIVLTLRHTMFRGKIQKPLSTKKAPEPEVNKEGKE